MMPDPEMHPDKSRMMRVAQITLVAGLLITAAKFTIFWLTNSIAVLTDATESIINVAAAASMLYTIWLSNRPADRDHPYGHGKIEFMTVGFEGWLILIAGVVIAYQAIDRLISPADLQRLEWGLACLGVVGVMTGGLAVYVWLSGKKYDSLSLVADGKHLMTDCLSTVGVLLGLLLVRWTGWNWLDPIVALVMAVVILSTSWRLLWQSIDGLMDKSDPADEAAIEVILDAAVQAGSIMGYHKVRHRHSGAFHWVDLHVQVAPTLTVSRGHNIASQIEGQIEEKLGSANATAHIEPFPQLETPAHEPPTDHGQAPAGQDTPDRPDLASNEHEVDTHE